MKEIWFKQKSYGFGWTPSNWKGWSSTLLFIIFMGTYPIYTDLNGLEFSELIFWIISALLISGFLGLCYFKGETPKWNWGKKLPEKKDLK